MIGKIRGKLDLVRTGYVIIDVSGIGYKVFVSEITLGKIIKRQEVELFVHTDVKEDHISLYGFVEQDELDMFELLLSISGVGPKASLAILTISTPGMIRKAIVNEDSSILTRVSGIGKKTADRIILELKNKVEVLPGKEEEQDATSQQEVVDALISMGYSATEARQALKGVPKEVEDISEKIRLALQGMKK